MSGIASNNYSELEDKSVYNSDSLVESCSSTRCDQEDSDSDVETQSPSKFRENVKRFLDEQRRAKAKALLEKSALKTEEMGNTGDDLAISTEPKNFQEDSLELEETSEAFNGEMKKQDTGSSEVNGKVKVFVDELAKFKSIPNPDEAMMSEHEFVKEVHYAFRKVLPKKILNNMTSKKCGLCHEEFPRIKEAWKHYKGYNHKRTVKCYVKGTYKGHPPFFKMCLEAISANKAGASERDIFSFVTQNYTLEYAEEKTQQLITWGIERLSENKYIQKNEKDCYFLVDPNLPKEIKQGASLKLPSLEMATSARRERGRPGNFSIITFERKINELFQTDLPTHLLKTLKPNYCGLCHGEIQEDDPWHHYSGSSHKRLVAKFSEGTYLGHPSYSKMIEIYLANENPKHVSEEGIFDFVVKKYKVGEDKEMIRQRIKEALSFILKSRTSSSEKREFSSRERFDSDRRHRESDGYRSRDRKRPYEEDRRPSRHSRDFSKRKERSQSDSRRARRPSPKRPHRDHRSPNSSPFINQELRKSFPTAKLPVVFINSAVGGEGPSALVIPKADPRDYA
eukprot:GFUD01041899.1.p1 GENE.GFUD01041899.1~~GFUD01041899.1.p1  ORF type:complete len:566 (+),score=148.83 GFUD01041899.1:174-1871(+)